MGSTGQKKPVISTTPKDVGNPQANWDRKKFDDLISDKGYACYIERAMRCPCAHEETNGQADSNCRNCNGTGWFFIEKTESVVVCTSMSNRSKYEQWSESNSGIVNISSRAQDKLGFMDRVTLIELESWFTQVLTIKNSLTEINKKFAFLIYDPIHVFDVYLYVDSDTPLIALKDSEYTVSNSKISIEKSIIQNYTQKENPRISIRYTHRPVYHIIDINRDLIKQKTIQICGQEDNNGKTNFPLNCVGRRAHYMLDNPNYDGESVFDNTDYNKINKYDR